MNPIGSHVQFTGLGRHNPKKQLKKSVKAAQKTSMEELALQRAKALEKDIPAIREALGQTLYSDQYGDFQGWHLLKLVQQSKEFKPTYSARRRRKGTIHLSGLKNSFEQLGASALLSAMLDQFKTLELLRGCGSRYSYNNYSHLELTERGEQVLKTFKKDVRGGGPLSRKRGNYTFQ